MQRAPGEAAVPLSSESLALLFEASDQQQTSPTLRPRGFLSPSHLSPCGALLCAKLQCSGWLGLTVRWARELAFSDRAADGDWKGAAGTSGPSGCPREEVQRSTPGTERLKAHPRTRLLGEGNRGGSEAGWLLGGAGPYPRDGEVVPAREEPARSVTLTPWSWAPAWWPRVRPQSRASSLPSPCSGYPRPW